MEGMSRQPSRPTTKLFVPVLVLLMACVAGASTPTSAQTPLIERALPDPARQARSAAWLDGFGSQRPMLLLAITELERERDRWRSGPGGSRCQNARRALGEVDRAGLLEVADYRLVSAIGDALQALEDAVRACSRRRYFELDYRLGLARRSLEEARELARTQAGR